MKNIYLFPVADSEVAINLDLVVAISGIQRKALNQAFQIYGNGKYVNCHITSEQCLVKEQRKLINAWKKHHKDKTYLIHSSEKSKSLYLLLDKIVSIGETFLKDNYTIHLMEDHLYVSKGASQSFENFEKTKEKLIKTWKEKRKTFSRSRFKQPKPRPILNKLKHILSEYLFKPLRAPEIVIDFEELLYISEIIGRDGDLFYKLEFVNSSPKVFSAYDVLKEKKEIKEFKANRTTLIEAWIKHDGKLSKADKELYARYVKQIMNDKRFLKLKGEIINV